MLWVMLGTLLFLMVPSFTVLSTFKGLFWRGLYLLVLFALSRLFQGVPGPIGLVDFDLFASLFPQKPVQRPVAIVPGRSLLIKQL